MFFLKNWVLTKLYQLSPFDLKGGLQPASSQKDADILSCLICTANRPDDLETILGNLSLQSLPPSRFEVVVINDGADSATRAAVDRFRERLNIIYSEISSPNRKIGKLRNETVALSKGKYVLFLDDDTRIMQNDFLEKSLQIFNTNPTDVIIPFGKATYGIVKLKYDFFDGFSFGNAGVLYTRDVFERLGGFRNELAAYEDIEMGIRLAIDQAKILKTDELIFLHPPFLFQSLQKPLSIGQSILKLKKVYPPAMWWLIYLNALRFLPYCLFPTTKNLQWFKISLGVLLAPFMRKSYYY